MRPALAVALRLGWRFLLIWLIETSLLLALGLTFPGVTILEPYSTFVLLSAVLVSLALSGINTIISPAIILLRLPLNVFTIGITALALNVAALYLASSQLPGFTIQPFFPNTVLAALLIAAVNAFLTAIIALDDEYAYFQFALHVFARDRDLRRALEAPSGTPGIVIVQIDGLSPLYLDYALNAGLMPSLRQLLDAGSHKVSTFEGGLPSQTSAAQAGIMYGNNANIPAFRWFDRTSGRMIVSNHPTDANRINNMSSTGSGLLRGGSSINNLINGDAARSLLTLSILTGHTAVPTYRALDDLGSFWFNPYTFTRTLVDVVSDIVVEVFGALRQLLRNEFPKQDRLFSAQILMRALTNVFLRDLSAYVVMLDICRGVPIIYTTFMGYDQVAHHAGPHNKDALRTLTGLDKNLRHILQTMRLLAPRPYELVVLSDHGQSFGMTFQQRYQLTLRDLIDQLTSQSTSVDEAQEYGDKQSYASALVQELDAVAEQMEAQPNVRFRRAALRQTSRTLAHAAVEPADSIQIPAAHMVVCASGNLAHIYMGAHSSRMSLDEVENLHPNLIQALVNHPGIGFVAVVTSHEEVIVLGKRGARNLNTGAITGSDPLHGYGEVKVCAQQILRLAEFDNSGDLILNSTLYADGTVASFENLIGVHGGLGGQQTHAFIAAPALWNLDTSEITNAYQIYDLLSRHRIASENL